MRRFQRILMVGALAVVSFSGVLAQDGESQEKEKVTYSWAETLALLNEQWNGDCEDEAFQRQEPVILQIGTVEAVAFVGEEITLPVRIKGVCDLAAAQLGIQLDRYVAELVRVEPMNFLAGDPPVDLDFIGLPPGGGSQKISIARPKDGSGVHGIGTLVRLVIRAKNQGVTNIQLVRPRLFTGSGAPVEFNNVPVRLTVMESSAGQRQQFKPRPKNR